MDINVKVTLDASPELKVILQGLFRPLTGGVAASIPAPAASSTGKSKLKNSDKVEKPADPEPVADTATETQDTTEEAADSTIDTKAEPTVTIEQIRALIPEAKAKAGTDKVKALLTKYGTPNVTNLPKENYDDCYNELKKLAA
jgi:hypothetical protein